MEVPEHSRCDLKLKPAWNPQSLMQNQSSWPESASWALLGRLEKTKCFCSRFLFCDYHRDCIYSISKEHFVCWHWLCINSLGQCVLFFFFLLLFLLFLHIAGCSFCLLVFSPLLKILSLVSSFLCQRNPFNISQSRSGEFCSWSAEALISPPHLKDKSAGSVLSWRISVFRGMMFHSTLF